MAIKLTREQRALLKHHGIGTDKVFDAGGRSKAAYGPMMKAGGYAVATGVTPCLRGHALRTRHGKCVVCQPASLAFARRHHEPAEVYIAHSPSGRLYKVGLTQNLADRFEQLNAHGCGGYYDWRLISVRTCADAGRVEHDIHVRLARFAVGVGYRHRSGSSRELFRCSRTAVLDAFRDATAADHPKARKADRIADLPLTQRTRNFLADAGVRTLGELLAFSRRELRRNEFLSPKAVGEILAFLTIERRSLRPDPV